MFLAYTNEEHVDSIPSHMYTTTSEEHPGEGMWDLEKS